MLGKDTYLKYIVIYILNRVGAGKEYATKQEPRKETPLRSVHRPC